VGLSFIQELLLLWALIKISLFLLQNCLRFQMPLSFLDEVYLSLAPIICLVWSILELTWLLFTVFKFDPRTYLSS